MQFGLQFQRYFEQIFSDKKYIYILFLLDIIHIIYEVISIDSWQRERTEGFAVQAHPLVAGARSMDLQCYRDLGRNTIWERLERIFIGGRSRHSLGNEQIYFVEPVEPAV